MLTVEVPPVIQIENNDSQNQIDSSSQLIKPLRESGSVGLIGGRSAPLHDAATPARKVQNNHKHSSAPLTPSVGLLYVALDWDH